MNPMALLNEVRIPLVEWEWTEARGASIRIHAPDEIIEKTAKWYATPAGNPVLSTMGGDDDYRAHWMPDDVLNEWLGSIENVWYAQLPEECWGSDVQYRASNILRARMLKFLRKNLYPLMKADRVANSSELYTVFAKRFFSLVGSVRDWYVRQLLTYGEETDMNDILKYRWAAMLWLIEPESYKEHRKMAMRSRTLRKSLSNMPGMLPIFSAEAIMLCSKEVLHRPLPRSRIKWLIASMIMHGDHITEIEEKRALLDAVLNTPDKTLHKLYKAEGISLRDSAAIFAITRRVIDVDLDIKNSRQMTWVGVLERSKAYHRQHLEDTMGENGHLPTKRPPIPLPVEEGLRFLETVQDMYIEGHEMRHCVGWNHWQNAVAGYGYYFAYNDGKERATVQVSWSGQVEQSYGPDNKLNKASEKASKILAKWGKGIADLDPGKPKAFYELEENEEVWEEPLPLI